MTGHDLEMLRFGETESIQQTATRIVIQSDSKGMKKPCAFLYSHLCISHSRPFAGTSGMTEDMQKGTAGRILVTGSTGYIGGRLVADLIDRSAAVRVFVRDAGRIAGRPWIDKVEVVEGDMEDADATAAALAGIDTAYYLVHSMQQGSDFAQRDRRIAENFIRAAGDVRHVIYLGGLQPVNAGNKSSQHLESRSEVGEMLRSALPVTEFRAGPVIGSGSASFEMLRYLTERLPLMVTPRWVSNQIQCIGIHDMLAYLLAAGEREASGIVEVGSSSLTFQEMMEVYADVRGLKRIFIPVPVLTPALAAEWIQFVTPISRNMAVPIVKGMISPLLADTTRAEELFPEIRPEQYRASVQRALDRLHAGDVETHWSGAQGSWPVRDVMHEEGVARDVRSVLVTADPAAVFSVVSSLGGRTGWLVDNWVWQLRGTLDKLIGGPGLRRGRRHPSQLMQGESVDFWRVEEMEQGRLLRLRAEMKLPGTAWLQWEIRPEDGGSRLMQSAMFAPTGTMGSLYWNMLYPIHNMMFGRLIRAIARRAVAA
jgi:uncharacterized protein YbjT (DUF2867 family)